MPLRPLWHIPDSIPCAFNTPADFNAGRKIVFKIGNHKTSKTYKRI